MHRPLVATVTAASTTVVAALLAACASAAMDARYDASLAPWKGASQDRLVATWGRPQRTDLLPGGDTALTFVVRHDLGAPLAAATPVVTTAANGSTSVIVAQTLAPPPPITCTTRFVLKDGRVASWTFDGIGCGAPAQ